MKMCWARAFMVRAVHGGLSGNRRWRAASPAFGRPAIQAIPSGRGVSPWSRAMLSAHDSVRSWRACHQRSSTPASGPGMLQRGRPVNCQQGSEVGGHSLQLRRPQERDGLDLHERTGTAGPDHRTVSPLHVRLRISGRAGSDQWCLSPRCPRHPARHSSEHHLQPVLQRGATPGQEILKIRLLPAPGRPTAKQPPQPGRHVFHPAT
jgi:hypothetical protein